MLFVTKNNITEEQNEWQRVGVAVQYKMKCETCDGGKKFNLQPGGVSVPIVSTFRMQQEKCESCFGQGYFYEIRYEN